VVTKTSPCSPTDKRVGSIGYRNPDNHDFDLVSGSPAIDAGDPADHPATDIEGLGRRGAPDAGAHEFGGIHGGGGGPSGGSGPTSRRGLVGAWNFDEAAGLAVRDSSGAANHGTISGATHVAGRFGRALRFDGRNDVVKMRDSGSLDLSRAMTLEAWVRPAARGTHWRPVVVKQRRSGAAYGLFSAGRRGGGSLVTTSSRKTLGGRVRGGRAKWRHLATTWNGRTLRLYVDGKLVSRRRLSRHAVNSAGQLRIGGGAGRWFKGAIDDVRIYRRALTTAEVRSDRLTPVG
jgi:hypothetical protein